jgi:hypothetical protein
MSLIPPRIIDFSSDDRTSGISSNFTVKLPQLNKNYNRVSVLAANIPKTYYNIQSPYNTFILEEASVQVTVTVLNGNYSFYGLNGFDVALQALLRSASLNSILYVVTADPLLGKYRITSNNNLISKIIFPLSSNLYKNFGCLYNSANSFNSVSAFLSTNVCIFTINVILINSSIVKGVSSQSTAANILTKININAGPSFSSIGYVNYSPEIASRECDVSDSLSIVITDIDGTELNLNGIPCDFSLLFFRFDDTNEIIRKNIYLNSVDKLMGN